MVVDRQVAPGGLAPKHGPGTPLTQATDNAFGNTTGYHIIIIHIPEVLVAQGIHIAVAEINLESCVRFLSAFYLRIYLKIKC